MARLLMVVGSQTDSSGSYIHEHYLCIPLKSQSLCFFLHASGLIASLYFYLRVHRISLGTIRTLSHFVTVSFEPFFHVLKLFDFLCPIVLALSLFLSPCPRIASFSMSLSSCPHRLSLIFMIFIKSLFLSPCKS